MESQQKKYTWQMLNTFLRMRKSIHGMNVSDKIFHSTFFAIISIGFYTSPENSGQGIKVSDLSRILGISRPAVTKMINHLEEDGYVKRFTTKTDRRLVYVALTDKGNQKLNGVEQCVQLYMQKLLDGLGYEDFEKMLQLLNKASDIFGESEKAD